MMILYMPTFLLVTLSTQVRKSILFCFRFLVCYHSFQIYGLDKESPVIYKVLCSDSVVCELLICFWHCKLTVTRLDWYIGTGVLWHWCSGIGVLWHSVPASSLVNIMFAKCFSCNVAHRLVEENKN